MRAVGQETWPSMRPLLERSVKFPHFSWLFSASIRNSEHSAVAGSEQDRTVGTPGTPAWIRSIHNLLHRSASGRDRFQFPLSKEANRMVIRRPEWILSVLS